MPPSQSNIEILDATDPQASKRILRMAAEGKFGIHTPRFWYLSGEMALITIFVSFWLLELLGNGESSWWLAILIGAPAAIVLYCASTWVILSLRIGIRCGDQWYVLDEPQGRGVALVKTRRGTTHVVGLSADTMEFADQLSDFLIIRAGVAKTEGKFVVPPGVTLE